MTGEQQYGPRASRGRARAKATARGGSDSEFINRELDTQEVAAYRQWRLDPEEVIARWTEMLEEGYRVNTKYDDYGSCCAAFVIPDAESVNNGYILAGRGGNAYRALSEAIFKHYVVFKGQWDVNRTGSRTETDSEF